MTLKMPTHLQSGYRFIQVPACMTGNSNPYDYRMKSDDFKVEDCIDATLYLPCGGSKGSMSSCFVFAEPLISFRP